MFLINLEKESIGLYVLSSCLIDFKAVKCHFSLYDIFKSTTCLLLLKLCIDMYSCLTCFVLVDTYNTFKAISSLLFSKNA